MAVPTAIRRASLEKDDVWADPTAISGKAEMAGPEMVINFTPFRHFRERSDKAIQGNPTDFGLLRSFC
jgi:hypothetical protein